LTSIFHPLHPFFLTKEIDYATSSTNIIRKT
jgi:hypothetical protein